MQGAHALLHLLCVMLGIIPAYAGSTRRRYRKPRWSRDHPRVCGEHALSVLLGCPLTGSSPRMRGAPGRSCGVRIPQRDHPRVCGEHLTIPRPFFPLMGSSPRMRGAHQRVLYRHVGVGIIPAYAGSTRRSTVTQMIPRDHPRVCGEHPLGDIGMQ